MALHNGNNVPAQTCRPGAQATNRYTDQRVEGTRRPEHPEHTAHDENEKDDVTSLEETGRHRDEKRENRERLSLDRVIAPAHDLPPDAIELARGQDVGR